MARQSEDEALVKVLPWILALLFFLVAIAVVPRDECAGEGACFSALALLIPLPGAALTWLTTWLVAIRVTERRARGRADHGGRDEGAEDQN